jgi:hypothetical protein
LNEAKIDSKLNTIKQRDKRNHEEYESNSKDELSPRNLPQSIIINPKNGISEEFYN